MQSNDPKTNYYGISDLKQQLILECTQNVIETSFLEPYFTIYYSYYYSGLYYDVRQCNSLLLFIKQLQFFIILILLLAKLLYRVKDKNQNSNLIEKNYLYLILHKPSLTYIRIQCFQKILRLDRENIQSNQLLHD
ncbi:unnamed protein product [Paramecium sonneborni]|uniref:Transmembrane protein n=1 Tax=Paramecium sonneborni TaxID=65129 RepID=A0A8S1RME8_9CILI|nr:unnamed protein product [Paramecium sonneborni]